MLSDLLESVLVKPINVDMATLAGLGEAAECRAVQSKGLPGTHGVGVQGEARQVRGERTGSATERRGRIHSLGDVIVTGGGHAEGGG